MMYAKIAEKYGHKIKFTSVDDSKASGDTYLPLPDIPQLRFIRSVAEFNLGESPRICRFRLSVHDPLLEYVVCVFQDKGREPRKQDKNASRFGGVIYANGEICPQIAEGVFRVPLNLID